jgi:hypothetical protein
MALFKPFRGSRAQLDAQPLHDGYAYFCTDDGTFHIDYVDADGNLQRKQIRDDIGQDGTGIGSEIFNDYENNTAFGDYSSAHGKSSKNFNSITKPEKIYYKALPGTVGHENKKIIELNTQIKPPFDFDYLLIDKSGFVDVVIQYTNATTEYIEDDKWYPSDHDSEDITIDRIYLDFLDGYDPDAYCNWYAVTEGKDFYDFESLQFTTDSTDALGEVNTVYSYVDSWRNTRYTLWQDYHPELTGKEAGYQLHTQQTGGMDVGKYQLRFKETYMQTAEYQSICSGDYDGYRNDLRFMNVCVYEDGSDYGVDAELTIIDADKGIFEATVYSSETGWTELSVDKANIVDVYKWTEATPIEELVTEVPLNDYIHNTILYEAFVNGGESFSLADGEASTVFGKDNITNGYGAIASGRNSIAAANYSLALGRDTEARGPGAFAVGLGGKATGMYSFAANEKGVASGYASIVIGDHCASTNYYSFSGGYQSKSSGHSAMAFGFLCEANGPQSVALGSAVKANGENSIAIGKANEVNGNTSAAIGYDNKVSGVLGIAIGTSNINDGCGIGIGESNTISDNGYAFGKANKVYGYNAVAALGAANTIIESAFNGAVAIGHKNTVSGETSCALGVECKSKGSGSVALGRRSEANGRASIAAGLSAIANGTDSVAIGRYSKAAGDYQTVIGRANAPISGKKAVLIVGTGMYDTEESRKNGLVVYEAGNVTIGADPVNAMDVVTKQYFDNNTIKDIGKENVSYNSTNGKDTLDSSYTDTLENTISTIVKKILSTKEVAYSGSYNDLSDKPKMMNYREDTIKAGETEKIIELPTGCIPLSVQARTASGELVMVDSVIKKGSETNVPVLNWKDITPRSGTYLLKLSDKCAEEGLNYQFWAEEYCRLNGEYLGGSLGSIIGGVYQLENGMMEVVIKDSRTSYPEYGNVEGDFIEQCDCFLYSGENIEEDILSITKIEYPTVTISAVDTDLDLTITTIYHEQGGVE